MDAAADNLSQHTFRSVGSMYLTAIQDSHGRRTSTESHDHSQCSFKPWIMITLFSLHWIASLTITITGIVLIFKPFSADSPCQLFYLMVYLRAGYWFGTYQLNERIKEPCRRLIDQNYDLYEKLAFYRKAPLQIVSFWSTALFAVNGYAKTFFDQIGLRNSDGDSCKHPIGSDLLSALESPQVVIVSFCAIESFALSWFYVVAFAQLINISATMSTNYTELEDQLDAKQKLSRQAEQIKILEIENQKLRKRAVEIGVLEDD